MVSFKHKFLFARGQISKPIQDFEIQCANSQINKSNEKKSKDKNENFLMLHNFLNQE